MLLEMVKMKEFEVVVDETRYSRISVHVEAGNSKEALGKTS